jgi:uncharacterized protein YnzC (UPF0291/DUF896 family)
MENPHMTPEQARQILSLRADDRTRQRIDELAAKSNQGILTPDEQAEYQNYVQVNKLLAILQAQAREFLDRNE